MFCHLELWSNFSYRFKFEEENYDNEGVINGVSTAYADYIENNHVTVACADTYIGGYSDNEMVSLWYWSPTPDVVVRLRSHLFSHPDYIGSKCFGR
jgi:hypothetical protein